MMHRMTHDTISLLQFMICREFNDGPRDSYNAMSCLSNLHVPSYPCHLKNLYAVTCWRKDKQFHKEVIEYELPDSPTLKTAPMDIEPVTSSVLFRWHKHAFPADLIVKEDCLLRIRVILDWKPLWETYIMVERGGTA
ncbi:MAG: hypothetical protein BWY44_01517 [Candidatus Omnitrophica bacterium ADurb.Bin292]|nr:MAG: hypothetical protein BWY44_01517 [Candidatus Omnitrophica bacterium ADurb.Bin292]